MESLERDRMMKKDRLLWGPWRKDSGAPLKIIDRFGRPTASCIVYLGPDIEEANARLIAAAPDMLEAMETALEMLIDSWGEDQIAAGDDQVANVLKAAIAKATGG